MKLRPNKYETLIFDLESDGLLDTMTTIHVLRIREYETGQVWTFRKNKRMDNIREGVEMLMQARMLVGHNIQQFDVPAIQLIFPWFDPMGIIRDTLVIGRLIFTDIKDQDFRLWHRGKLPGQLIGGHTLKAWGYRLGLQKGDYMDDKLAEAKARGIIDPKEQMAYVPLDIKRAEEMAAEMEEEIEELSAKAIEHFGQWYAPVKKRIVKMLWEDPDGLNAKKKYLPPREEFGEDYSRAIWAEVTVAKQTRKFKEMYKVNPTTGERSLNNSVEEGAMFCPVKRVDFNPGSRANIIDRLTTIYGWEPISFTETGGASVDDDAFGILTGE